MNGKGGHNEQATYHRRYFGNDGNQDPNETLVDGAAYQWTENREHHGQRGALRAHLFP